jgi:type IV secretory pathway VirB4 component
MVDDVTLALRDGSLLQVIRIDGLMFETADSETLNYRKDMRDAMLRAIGSSRFAVYHHILRRRVEPDLAGTFLMPSARGWTRRGVKDWPRAGSMPMTCSLRWSAVRRR